MTVPTYPEAVAILLNALLQAAGNHGPEVVALLVVAWAGRGEMRRMFARLEDGIHGAIQDCPPLKVMPVDAEGHAIALVVAALPATGRAANAPTLPPVPSPSVAPPAA